jgi:hypothetical protein
MVLDVWIDAGAAVKPITGSEFLVTCRCGGQKTFTGWVARFVHRVPEAA